LEERVDIGLLVPRMVLQVLDKNSQPGFQSPLAGAISCVRLSNLIQETGQMEALRFMNQSIQIESHDAAPFAGTWPRPIVGRMVSEGQDAVLEKSAVSGYGRELFRNIS
jgi:hypothetical protein